MRLSLSTRFFEHPIVITSTCPVFIVIAHRLSTVKDSDQIFVVNDGNIAAHGTHEELLASCPLYEEMWNAHISAKDTVKEEN